tara:strand:+ start:529 stop:771 length:243 start_codon:yes stop_codon:yes gene_type:complete
MKPTKKKPAKRKNGDTPKGMLIMKLKKLATAIEMKKGPSMDIDDYDYRWVDDKIQYLESNTITFTKENMEQANELWRIYG